MLQGEAWQPFILFCGKSGRDAGGDMSEILLAAGVALYVPLVFWVLRPVYGFFDLCPQRDASALEDTMRLLRAEAYMRRHPLKGILRTVAGCSLLLAPVALPLWMFWRHMPDALLPYAGVILPGLALPLLWVNLGALALEISFFRDMKAGQILFGGMGAGMVYLIQSGVLALGVKIWG